MSRHNRERREDRQQRQIQRLQVLEEQAKNPTPADLSSPAEPRGPLELPSPDSEHVNGQVGEVFDPHAQPRLPAWKGVFLAAEPGTKFLILSDGNGDLHLGVRAPMIANWPFTLPEGFRVQPGVNMVEVGIGGGAMFLSELLGPPIDHPFTPSPLAREHCVLCSIIPREIWQLVWGVEGENSPKFKNFELHHHAEALAERQELAKDPKVAMVALGKRWVRDLAGANP